MRRSLAVIGLVVLVFGAGLASVAARSRVDWRAVRAVGIQSDDWGLAGFVPAADSWQGLAREALGAGRFPPAYWQSTLEDSATVARLAAILVAHKGRDGVPAVFQPNYVMGSLAWDAVQECWLRYDLPHWPVAYARPGMWTAVTAARQRGVWHPEFHATLHYDPQLRKRRGLESALAAEATRRGIMLFPASEDARELAPWRSRASMRAELDHSLAVFARVFGRPVGSVIAPDYTWHAWIEDLWSSRGLHVIQAKREQRNPEWWPGWPGRGQKYLDRQWSRLVHPGRIYLERNCRLETVQSPEAEAVVAACVAATRAAWRKGEPAIVETHRVNYAQTDPELVARGLRALAGYLTAVCSLADGPVFLCDTEIAQLESRGASWRVAGDRLILRNPSHAARVVVLGGQDLPERIGPVSGPLFFRLSAGAVQVVPLARLGP